MLSNGETVVVSRKPQTLRFVAAGVILEVGGKAASDTFPCSFWTDAKGLARGKFATFSTLEKPAADHLGNVTGLAKDLSTAVTGWFTRLSSQTDPSNDDGAYITVAPQSDSDNTPRFHVVMPNGDEAERATLEANFNEMMQDFFDYAKSQGVTDITPEDALRAYHQMAVEDGYNNELFEPEAPMVETEREKSLLTRVTDYPEMIYAFPLALGTNLQDMFASFGEELDAAIAAADEDDLNWFRYELASIYGEALHVAVDMDLREYELRGKGFDEDTENRIMANFLKIAEADPSRIVRALLGENVDDDSEESQEFSELQKLATGNADKKDEEHVDNGGDVTCHNCFSDRVQWANTVKLKVGRQNDDIYYLTDDDPEEFPNDDIYLYGCLECGNVWLP